MINYILSRLLQSLAVMLIVAIAAFAVFQFVGDPVLQMVPEDASDAEMEKISEVLGLNDPIPTQLLRYIKNVATGEFGISYFHKRPVEDLIGERLPATIELGAMSVLISVVLGIPLGIYTGLNRSGRLARALMAASLVGISLPTFLIGILLIYLFSVELNWLPSFGRGETVPLPGGWSTGLLTLSGLQSIILPALTMALFQTTMVMRLVRAEIMDVMRRDFVKFAKARGLTNRRVQYRHALLNTLMPVVTVVGLQLGSVIAFAIITESVFQWPGMGQLFLQSIHNVDIPIMSTYLILIALIFVIINLTVDLLYFLIDPRLRGTGGRGTKNV